MEVPFPLSDKMDSSEVGKALSNTHHETHDAQVNKNRPVSRGADTAAQMIGGRQVVVTDEDVGATINPVPEKPEKHTDKKNHLSPTE